MKILITSNQDENTRLEKRNNQLYLIEYSDSYSKYTKLIRVTQDEADDMDADNLHLQAMAFFSGNPFTGKKSPRVEYQLAFY